MRESIQSDVYASVLITLIPAILCFGLRFYARSIKKVPLWYDDWLAVVGLVAALGYNASVFFMLHYGMGLHLPDLSITYEKALYYSSVNDIIQEMTYTIGIGATQLSLLALYWRLFRTATSAKTSIFLITAFTVIWLIVRIFITLFQCQPLAYYWDRSIEGKCNIDPSKFYIGSVASHLVIDIVLMILPAVQINHLKIPLAQRVAVTVMFMFGILICVAAIMMIVVSTRYNSYAEDVMWNGAPPTYWSAVEIHLSVIACESISDANRHLEDLC
ncbi:Fc.00g096920.m01.CDS01 [Cosmosporella sp. VM-42]